ncbi:MAG: IS21 family transposase, partial [Pirellulales bacterium]
MANQLKMAVIDAILTLHGQGWSQRAIASWLEVNRETVSRHLRLLGDSSKPANLHAGNQPPAPEATLPVRRSYCDRFQESIEAKRLAGLTAQRIYQDLVAELGFACSYSTVQRYVRRLERTLPLPFRRLECAPGEEAQVDFGVGAPLVTVDGQRRRTHVFRSVLSHSRKAYSEAGDRQTTDNFIRCLENAFVHFGGVPQTQVIDNLKAAVTQADWYDPELNPKLRAFAAHYGVAVLPTKPRTPRHKGKVERGVGYVQSNALKGHSFASLAAQNAHLVEWETNVADCRIHGTTRKQVGILFREMEGPALRPLPAERFPLFYEAQRTVHRDGHVSVERAYYSVPVEYLTRTVWVRWDARLVRIFNHRLEQTAIHAKQPPGKFSTQRTHIATEKINGVERGAAWLLQKAGAIGPHAEAWAAAMLEQRGVEGLRVLQGLSALAAKHGASAIDAACKVAQSYAAYRLRTVRELVKRHAPEQVEFEFLAEHPLIRNLSDYSAVARRAIQRTELATLGGRNQPGPPVPSPEP